MMTEEFKQHCIVELMGHNILAGLVSEQVIAGQAFVRVDVPKTKTQDAYTKLYGAGAIYCLTPCDEFTAKKAAEGLRREPIHLWDIGINPSNLLGDSDDHESDDL